jgi:hypothetical protein
VDYAEMAEFAELQRIVWFERPAVEHLQQQFVAWASLVLTRKKPTKKRIEPGAN